MDKVGDAQFCVMCNMWGVDQAIKALTRMGMQATDEQIAAERKKEAETHKRLSEVFKTLVEGNNG